MVELDDTIVIKFPLCKTMVDDPVLVSDDEATVTRVLLDKGDPAL